jgi:hypothetical protein
MLYSITIIKVEHGNLHLPLCCCIKTYSNTKKNFEKKKIEKIRHKILFANSVLSGHLEAQNGCNLVMTYKTIICFLQTFLPDRSGHGRFHCRHSHVRPFGLSLHGNLQSFRSSKSFANCCRME